MAHGDFTFSVPKSVSIIWSVVAAVVRLLIQKFQQLAVAATLRYAKQNLVYSRRQRRRRIRSVGVIAALWEHGTNRHQQAQLHTHAILMNAAVGRDSKIRSIYTKILFRHKKVLGAYYRAYLANLLETELGFRLIRKGDSFEIEGVPEDLIKLHSKRRAEILAYLEKNGLHGAVAAAEAALKTRRTKKDIPPRAELFERWKKLNQDHGFTEASVEALRRPKSRNPARDLPEALASAKACMAERYSHFSQKDFLFETLLEAPKWGITPENIPQAVQDYLATDPDIVKLQPIDGETRYSTRAILKREARLLRLATSLRRASSTKVNRRRAEKILSKARYLRRDQVKAIRYLIQHKGSLSILCGPAGSGKSTVLRVARKIWKKHGYHVIGATLTGIAGKVLESSSGIPTDTIHRRMGDYKIGWKRTVKDHGKQFLRAAQGKRTFRLKKPQPMKVDKNTIVVVNEAGMLGTRHMRMIMCRVQQGGGTLILVGDPTQLPSIQGASPFRSLCRRAGFAELTEISRQKDEWAREAVQLFANGEPAKALRLYANHRKITVREDRSEAMKALVLDWTAVGLTHPEQVAVLVSTNVESEAANLLCQEKRLRAGCLDAQQSMQIRDEDTSRGISYTSRVHVGDRILFTLNSPRYHVQNGALGTVIAMNSGLFRNYIAVKLDNGEPVVIPVKDFPHMRLGYAMTTYKAQGMTVPEVYVLVGGPMQNLPSSYVQASRAIRSTRFYTEKAVLDEHLEYIDESPLAKQMVQAPDLNLASDLLPGNHLPADPATPLPESPQPSNSPTAREPARKRRRRRRKPAQPQRVNQTYAIAQYEEFNRRRKRLRELQAAPLLPHSPAEQSSAPNCTTEVQQLPTSLLAMHYLPAHFADTSDWIKTTNGLPIELVLDAHFVNSTVQAEVQHCEEEEQRRLDEYLERIRQEREAAAAQKAARSLARQSEAGESAFAFASFARLFQQLRGLRPFLDTPRHNVRQRLPYVRPAEFPNGVRSPERNGPNTCTNPPR